MYICIYKYIYLLYIYLSMAQVFSCEFCEIFKNTFFIEHFL